MTYDEVVKYFGSGYKISQICGFASGSPYMWKKNGFIPLRSQRILADKSKGVLKIRAEDCIPVVTKKVTKKGK